ncbi:hypothetical protein NP493_216g01025 [Ridgeia piscesae]|uniref:L-lactate dehydrogenase n=1 Tax=Ridgeia piscesae TaxID=27915 RepID=A0AAD9P0N9_RIDPI|nr:hypothetical protein NP493_216g01025 [Ridgeia piscesae]
MSARLKESLMLELVAPQQHPSAKISIVGVGQVGMASAYSIMLQGVASVIALVDVNEDKLRGEMMDLQHGQSFRQSVTVIASTDYSVTQNSKVCVITAGARQREGETRIDLVHRNVEIFKHIIPNLVKYNPDAILVVVSNPVDILTYVTWKLSGFPKNRVFGSGTMLDSSRFRFLISQKLDIAPQSCHAYIIGEHGDTSVAVWSGVNVAGTHLLDVSPLAGTEEDPEHWEQIHRDVVNSAYEIIRLKGYTSWAIGVMVCTLCHTILKNERKVYTMSTVVKGLHGIDEDVFLSLPCVVSENGINNILRQQLNADETKRLQESAKSIAEVISSLRL